MPKAIDPRRAFVSGRVAKTRGFIRLSPFYEDEAADKLFFNGYDGLTEEQAGVPPLVLGGMAKPDEKPDTTTSLIVDSVAQ